MGELIVVGLGAGRKGLMTEETKKLLTEETCVRLRTAKHPTVDELKEEGYTFESFDSVYEQKDTFEEVYDTIVEACLSLAEETGRLIYAVPGSPLVAEKTVQLLRERAEGRGVKLTILPAMSFLEVLYVRLGVDPINGLTILDGDDVGKLAFDNTVALVVTQVYDRAVASEVKLALMEQYDDEQPITFVRNLGLDDEEVRTIPLYELDRQPNIDHLTSIYVPRREPREQTFDMSPLTDVMTTLRSPGGCPWDIEQTHESLRRYMIEEVYEVIEAIENEDASLLCEELGDLLLQIVFHARVAEECGHFSMQDVIDGVTAKMIRRHPHVFGDITVSDAGEVLVNWDAIKAQEKVGQRKGALDGVSPGLPALMAAFKLQKKASKVGFDWDEAKEVWEKVREELGELAEASAEGDKTAIEEEFGDVLFSLVNLSRFLHIEPETSLTAANHKFRRRFTFIERKMEEQGEKWQDMTIDTMNELWEQAKQEEK